MNEKVKIYLAGVISSGILVGGGVLITTSQNCPEFVLKVPVGSTTQETCISAETRDFILNSKAPNSGFGGLEFQSN